jgi:hypothetical protein
MPAVIQMTVPGFFADDGCGVAPDKIRGAAAAGSAEESGFFSAKASVFDPHLTQKF